MKQLSFILVGAGGFGAYWQKTLMPGLREYASPVAVVDISEAALNEARQWRVVPENRYYTDIEAAIGENPCDFLVLVIPPNHRMRYIDLAIAHKIDVLCEKPVADTMENACLIYKKLADAGRKCSVTVSHRMERDKQSLNRLLDSGSYGKLNYIVGKFAMRRRIGNPYNRPQTGYEDMVRASISGGVIHELDTLRGLCRSNAAYVTAKAWRFELGDGGAGFSSLALIEMENGVQCALEHSGANATETNAWSGEYYRAECANGTLILDRGKLTAACDLGFPHPTRADLPLAEGIWDHTLILRDFCNWLNGGPEPETSIRDNLNCCALTFAAVESSLEGRTVDVRKFSARYGWGV